MKNFIYKKLTNCVGKNNINKNTELKTLTTFKIGGPAWAVITPESVEQLIKVLLVLQNEQVPYFVLGGGSNVLADSRGYNGVVLLLTKINKLFFYENCVIAEAGVRLGQFIAECASRGLSGLEKLTGVPGTVGGAVFMNAGAFGVNMADHVTGVYAFVNGKICYYKKEELLFAYRTSVFHSLENAVIIMAEFEFKKEASEEIKKRMREGVEFRKQKHPHFPSAGSVFKNIDMPAGKLIEECGLKGLRLGGAQISEKHANFIVNMAEANSQDVINLIEACKQKVKQQFGLDLKLEIKLLK